jgi:hypothetical protein
MTLWRSSGGGGISCMLGTEHMAQIGVERDALLVTLEQTIAELKESLTFNTIGQKVTTHFQNQRVLANARKQVAEQVQRRQQLEAMMNAMQVQHLHAFIRMCMCVCVCMRVAL